MSDYGKELGRFSANGKTFFFNKLRARNDSDYLKINAMYGEGRRESLNVFQEHAIGFWGELSSAFQEVWGIKMDGPELTVEEHNFDQCPDCGSGPESWFSVVQDGTPGAFRVICDECKEILINTMES